MRLPVGLASNDRDEVMFDPDRSVFDAIGLVFDSFRRNGVGDGGGEMDAPREHRAASAPAERAGQRRAALGSSARAASLPAAEQSPLRRRLRLWPDARRAAGGRDRTMPRRADGGLARLHPGCPCGLHRLGRVPSHRATLRGNAAAFLESGSRTAAPRRGGGAVAVAGDLRPLRPAHGHAIQPRSAASQPAGALLLRLQRRAGPLRTEDLPDHAWRSRRRRDITVRDRRVER